MISGLFTRVHDDPNLGTSLTASMIPDFALGARPSTLAHLWRNTSSHGLCERRSEGAPLVERGSKKRRYNGDARNERRP